MAEIYKLKKGSNPSVILRYAGDLSNESDYFAKLMNQSSNKKTITNYEETQWLSYSDDSMPFPEPPYNFPYSYDHNVYGFADFIDTYIIGRTPKNGDVITFENYDSVFVFSDSNIVWNVKKGDQEVYSVKKGDEVVFQRQYLRGYEDASLSSFVSSTGTSIKWRITNKDPDVAADTYANVVKSQIPSLDFSFDYKRGTLRTPSLPHNTFTTSNLDDGSRYYCRAGLKHPTLKIMPIIESTYSSYDLPIAAPSVQLIARTESSATIRFINNSNTKTIEIYAGVGTSSVTRTSKGTIEPGGFHSDVTFTGLDSNTSYNLYYHARYTINSSPEVPGTWKDESDYTSITSAVDFPITIGGSCTFSDSTVYYSTVTYEKARCVDFKPSVPTVNGYLPGPNASNFYTETNYFTTLGPLTPKRWTRITLGDPSMTFDRYPRLISCDTNGTDTQLWLESNYPPGNYAVNTIVAVTSKTFSGITCDPWYFRADL